VLEGSHLCNKLELNNCLGVALVGQSYIDGYFVVNYASIPKRIRQIVFHLVVIGIFYSTLSRTSDHKGRFGFSLAIIVNFIDDLDNA
jgi:hypothetical protein